MNAEQLSRRFSRAALPCFFFVSTLLLSACSSLQWSTAWSLRGLEPTELNPSVVRLMLDLPKGATFANATLNMRLQYRDEETAIVDEEFALDLVSSGRDFGAASLSRQLKNPIVIQIPSTHVKSVLRFQDLFRQEQVDQRGGSASFGFGFKFDPTWINTYCETDGRPLTLSAWILVDELQGYLPLVENSSLAKMLDQQWQGICGEHITAE